MSRFVRSQPSKMVKEHTLFDLNRLGRRHGANDDVDDGSGARLAASRSKREVGVVENVAEMKQPQVGSGLGLGLGPRLGPVLPDVGSNRFDCVVGVESPRLALACDEKCVEMHCCGCGCGEVACARWRNGGRHLSRLWTGWGRDLLRAARGGEQGRRLCVLVLWARGDGGLVRDYVGEVGVFVAVRRAVVCGAGGVAALVCRVHDSNESPERGFGGVGNGWGVRAAILMVTGGFGECC